MSYYKNYQVTLQPISRDAFIVERS